MWQLALGGIVAFGLACSAFSPAFKFNLLQGGLFMDDAMIARNEVVVGPTMDWARLLRTDYWGLDMFDGVSWTHKSFRPVTVLSFRFDYQTFSFDSTAFHRHNIVLHGLAGLLILKFKRTHA